MSMMIALLLAAASPSLPSGDFMTPLPRKMDKAMALAFEAFGRDRVEQTLPVIDDWTKDQLSTALKEALTDTTSIVYQRGHGVYVEYTAADGAVLMWYPYNGNVVRGRWGIQADASGTPRACFHYSNAVNPVTGVFEPTECVSPVQTLSRNVVLSERKGDVFNLSSGKLPYPKSPKEVPEWPH
ncbi:MAG: hypothetical protein IPN84_07975 [Sphingomonadales bacterium]|nr:hypothetical protein [Sphingomonadales bacterium]